MGERKVLNKYIPADFDPALIPRGKKLSSKDGTVPVRMMLPFSMQCSTCATFLYRGRKYNSKKEAVAGPDGRYLGIQRWRFYIKCNHCSRPITFTTDPKNADYEMESGATRNFELNKEKLKEEAADEEELQESTKLDPIKALEDRVLDSQREMADLNNLEDIKAMNARHVQLSLLTSADLDALNRTGKLQNGDDSDDNNDNNQDVLLTAEDEALVKSIQFGKKPTSQQQQQQQQQPAQNEQGYNYNIQRLNEVDEARFEEVRRQQAAAVLERKRSAATAASAASSSAMMPAIAIVGKKRRKIPTNNDSATTTAKDDSATSKQQQQQHDSKPSSQEPAQPAAAAATGLADLLGGYGDSSSSDSD
jgi:Saf4/Yju2 protein